MNNLLSSFTSDFFQAFFPGRFSQGRLCLPDQLGGRGWAAVIPQGMEDPRAPGMKTRKLQDFRLFRTAQNCFDFLL